MQMRLRDKLFIYIQKCIPQVYVSCFLGALADCKIIWVKNICIQLWVLRYNISLQEAERECIQHYISFNDFFTRTLKKNVRPLPKNNQDIIAPADGRLTQFGFIISGLLIQAKGIYFSVNALLNCTQVICESFEKGHFFTIYLAPNDYHRVHMPCDATLKSIDYIPGRLFSVNQTTSAYLPDLFSKNERLVCWFETKFGLMAIVLIGAMLVASLHTIWTGKIERTKQCQHWNAKALAKKQKLQIKLGDEMGFFQLGSTVIVCFENGHMGLSEHFKPDDIVCMGQSLGQWIS
ncbi:MAG: phosphatidylserine decarboxylase [Endozoicomonadaceae bacterium]|nr:phosphatidylserine decarboxylase [Endozoicomonadaceae bacterium]